MKRWETSYNGNKIVVENRMSSEKLFVNGELQDECIGIKVGRVRLFGHLVTGEKIKVSLGGNLAIRCRIFIDDKLILKGE